MQLRAGNTTAHRAVRPVRVQFLSPDAFAPFGEVVGPRKTPPVTMPAILQGGTVRFARQVGTPPAGFDVGALDILHLWDPKVTFALDGEPPGVRYMVVHARPLEFHIMERHLLGNQVFVPLGGKSTVFAVAPPQDLDDPEAVPDPESIRAFLLDGSCAVSIRPGTWHWTPIPVGADDVAFVTLTRARVRLDDMWMVDLRQRLGISFQLVLPEEYRESSERE